MSVKFNHTLVHARDSKESAKFMTDILGLPAPTTFGYFQVVSTSNEVNLDFYEPDGDLITRHYAFLVSETEFDEIFERIKTRGINYWADPRKKKPGEINNNDGGRGVYFDDPSGNYLEVITRPYGG